MKKRQSKKKSYKIVLGRPSQSKQYRLAKNSQREREELQYLNEQIGEYDNE